MPETQSISSVSTVASFQPEELAEIDRLLRQAAEMLPAQGPISAFVFLNTLQAFEHLPFDEGVLKGSRLFGCQPYLPEAFYREKLERGRIRLQDVEAVLREDLGASADEPVGELGTRCELRMAMLRHPLRAGPPEELRWFIAETDALTKFCEEVPPEIRQRMLDETKHWLMRDLRDTDDEGRDRDGHGHAVGPRKLLGDLIARYGESSIEDWSAETWETISLQALWRVCRSGAQAAEFVPASAPPRIRHRDLLLDATSQDSDALVDPLLIRFCAAFCDQGFAPWALPHREDGFLKSFCRMYGQGKDLPDYWTRGLSDELARIDAAGLTGPECVAESLQLLGVGAGEEEDFITATLLALRGWAGILWQMEVRGDRVPLPAPAGTLMEFLAVRLVLERTALRHVAVQSFGFEGPLESLREEAFDRIERRWSASPEQRAFLVFQVAENLGWLPSQLDALSRGEWSRVIVEFESFTALDRRRNLHAAFERRYREQVLDAFSVQTTQLAKRVESPRFQATFCIDTREESFRRHLEEFAPDVETFAAAGFFSVPIYYRGVADANYATLCPIVVQPKHWVIEEVAMTLEEQNRRRAKTRRTIGAASHGLHLGSRSIAGGAILTAGIGVFASIPLLARVLFPGLTASIRRHAGRFVAPPPVTRLRMERITDEPNDSDEGIGFSVDEMAAFGERVLRDIGLINGFARLVLFFGHGSFCLNNPHKSCYDCGACSGSAGSPNARALAAMLNDPRVRIILEGRGLSIPRSTVFLGGLHNTCDDTITFLDLDQLPSSHVKDVNEARRILEEACIRNAHERCRRFHSAPLTMSTIAAHRHVKERSEDLAQVRPEFGNASNAAVFVGRRSRVRGMYMDRRMFMHSYDPDQDDDEATILGRVLGPVVVVCSGINLQYYFSYVDSPGWGSGTKLPHNVTSLLGVMDGHASDMRTGLPWQGVEIHEPLRLLMIFECTPAALRKVMTRNEGVARIIRNGWVQLALLDPNSNRLLEYRNGEFHPYHPTTTELPQADSSIDWYRGWRDHLGFAQIKK